MHLELLFPMLSSGFRLSKLDLSGLVSLGSECRFGYKVVMFLSGCFMCPRVELAVNGVLGI